MCHIEVYQKMSIFSVIFSAILYTVSGQLQLLPNGDPYFCVPVNICPDSGGIDPRIVTPDDTGVVEDGNLQQLIQEVFSNKILTDGTPSPGVVTCPAGRVPCYAQGSMSNCGVRLVAPSTVSPTDGFASFGAYPWQAYLRGPTGYLGSGSLLSPYHVLTAAHKVLAFQRTARYPNPPYAPINLTVTMGVNNPANINTDPTISSPAAQIIIYDDANYDNSTLKNNLAIIRLRDPIRLVGQNSINTICLPPSTATSATYATPPQACVVSGWGQVQPTNNAVPTALKQVNLNTTDINTCEAGFVGRVNTAMYLDKTGGQLCAGGQAQKDACFQDGGAPLTCGSGTAASRYTVAGIVIWGKSCGIQNVYGVYTNVPTYRSWIVNTIATPVP